MLGAVSNTVAIIIGCLVGLLLKGGVPERFNDTIMKGLSLFVLFVGISGTLKANDSMVIVFSVVIGAVVGELIDIDRWFKRLGDSIEKRFKGKGGGISEAFVTTSLIYCVGAMAIVGSLESGLTGNHQILLSKSVLDGVAAIIFTSTFGIGVILSSVSVFLYEGSITLASSVIKGVLVTSVINDMTAVGSLLIIGTAFNVLGITKIKVANLLPGVFVPILYQMVYPHCMSFYHVILSTFAK